MKNIEHLVEIAEFICAKDLAIELRTIKKRSAQTNAELIFPLVGEFSAGKTTLINALTDCKKLETATQPTTATIYEIHFGCEKCYATVLNENGETVVVDDIAELKNDTLANAIVVDIFDSSTRIPSTTILVDTPGLSSPNPKHKQTLVDFLPQADGILLVTDVNQQITRSLTDFIEMMKLSKRPIYLVITKCDTKSQSELEAAKQYISDNCKLPIQQMACVSATKNDLDELYTLLGFVQKDKNEILKRVNEQRVKNVIAELLIRIDELLHSSSSDKELDEAIRRQEYDLNRLNRNIDKLIESTDVDIQDKGRGITRRFEDVISEKLESLVTSKCDNFDGTAVSLINNTSSLLLNDYKSEIKEILRDKVKANRSTDDAISLHSLTELDMSELSITGISYNMDLNTAGHEYDGTIATVTKVAAAAAAVAAVAAYGGTALAGAGVASTVDTAFDVADTVSDVASIASNKNAVSRLEKAANFIGRANDNLSTINNYNEQIGQNVGGSKGIVESMVGFVTDKTMGKPQRRRAIHKYMDETLLPEFSNEMQRISKQLTDMIAQLLHQEAAESITQKNDALRQLKKERSEKKESFEQRMSQLRDYKNELVTF